MDDKAPSTNAAPVAAKVAVRKPASRKAGPLIMVLCLLLAVLAVLFMPLLVGGAQTGSSSSSIALPETLAEYTSAEAALQQLAYAPVLPTALPEGASVAAYRVLEGDTLEVEYRLNKATVVYRTAPGNDDLTGDHSEYAYMAYEDVAGVNRSYAGVSEAKLSLAFWAADGYSYALVAADGVDAETLREMAEAIG